MSFAGWLEKIEKVAVKDAEDILPEAESEAKDAIARLTAVAAKVEAIIKELEAKF
jgi:hypothetical protein